MFEDTSQAVIDDTSQEPEITQEPSQIEPIEPQVETPLYAGKFKTPEEMEHAYVEAQRKISEQGRTLSQRTVVPEAPKEVELEPEVLAAAETLKKAGFITKDELAVREKQREEELKLDRLLDANPDLRDKEVLIRTLGKSDNRAWEDIITDPQYGLKESGKLLKAKTRDVKGMPAPKEPPKQKTLSQMTSAEYAQWKKENLGRQQF